MAKKKNYKKKKPNKEVIKNNNSIRTNYTNNKNINHISKNTFKKNNILKNVKQLKKLHYKNLTSNVFAILFIFIFIIIFCICFSKIILWYNDNNNHKNIKTKLLDTITITEISNLNSDSVELVNEPESELDIYWKYKDVSLIDVDFTNLLKENKDTIGWIQVSGTNINYPIVQSNDNKYYLNHDFTKKYNGGGWIFLDYRNDFNNLSNNNIIYGHRRYNSSMFGSLKNVLNKEWLNNTDNHIIKISTLEYNYLFQVFSVYSVPNESYYIQTDFQNNELYTEFLDTIVKRSIYNFNTEVNNETKTLTLSTCHNDSDRLVVHSKLIKQSKK